MANSKEYVEKTWKRGKTHQESHYEVNSNIWMVSVPNLKARTFQTKRSNGINKETNLDIQPVVDQRSSQIIIIIKKRNTNYKWIRLKLCQMTINLKVRTQFIALALYYNQYLYLRPFRKKFSRYSQWKYAPFAFNEDTFICPSGNIQRWKWTILNNNISHGICSTTHFPTLQIIIIIMQKVDKFFCVTV